METEIEINFSDVTMASTDGIFVEVNQLMNEQITVGDQWMIESSVTIVTEFGAGEMMLHFYGTKNVIIMDYVPSMVNVEYNPDIRALSEWCRSAGWNLPEPHPSLINKDRDFWKFFYDTFIINSSYFDKYGKREE